MTVNICISAVINNSLGTMCMTSASKGIWPCADAKAASASILYIFYNMSTHTPAIMTHAYVQVSKLQVP